MSRMTACNFEVMGVLRDVEKPTFDATIHQQVNVPPAKSKALVTFAKLFPQRRHLPVVG